jgi:hypothetical protein
MTRNPKPQIRLQKRGFSLNPNSNMLRSSEQTPTLDISTTTPRPTRNTRISHRSKSPRLTLPKYYRKTKLPQINASDMGRFSAENASYMNMGIAGTRQLRTPMEKLKIYVK